MKLLAPLLVALGCDSSSQSCDTGLACTYDTAYDTADTGVPYDGPTSIDCADGADCEAPVVYACDEVSWTYDVYTVGLTSAALLDIASSDGRTEADHALEEIDADDDGWWDHWGVLLDVVGTEDEQVADPQATTVFACDEEESMSWSVTVYDASGEYADCLTWGLDTRDFEDEGCTPWL